MHCAAEDLLADGRALTAAMSNAVYSATQHGPNIAFVTALGQLARHTADALRADTCMPAELEEAALQRQQELHEDHGITARGGAQPVKSAAELLQELEELQGKLASIDLHTSCESAWQPFWEQRNACRADLIVLLGTEEARLEKRREQLNAVLSNLPTAHTTHLVGPEGPSREGVDSGTACAAVGSTTAQLAAKTTELDVRVQEMAEKSAEARMLAGELTSQLTRSSQQRHRDASQERDECVGGLRVVQGQLRRLMNAHERWTQGRELLVLLSNVHAELKKVKQVEKKVRRDYEDLVGSSDEDVDESEPDVAQARKRSITMRDKVETLQRLREGTQTRILELATTPGSETPPAGDEPSMVHGGRHRWYTEEDTALRLDLPELPVLARRVVVPFKLPSSLKTSPRDTERHHVESMLRRDGLLVERCYENYSEDGLPDGMHAMTLGKMHVKAARLRGAKPGPNSLKILKAFPIAEYKRLKRAVVTAHRLKHPGIVPVECAFVDKKQHVVVTQSRLYEGGNMRAWARGKSDLALTVAAQRIAASITRLHESGTLHRDIKPENVVFRGAADDAWPALCDFDLSLDMRETASSTMMRGTLLYMAPEPRPSPKSDVFSFGVTLLDMLVCGGNQDQLHMKDSPVGSTLDIMSACGGLEAGNPLHRLIQEMLSADPSVRPTAADVEQRLDELAITAASKYCPLCQESFGPAEGLSCYAKPDCESHFVCHGCLSDDIIKRQVAYMSVDDLTDDYVHCYMKPSGCESPAFPLQVVARCCTADAFAAIGKRMEELRRSQMERDFDAKRRALEQELLQKSKAELEVLSARRHIEEEIMVLRCPKCKLAFCDYDGCAALTCHGCNCGFCALCQEDCGTDAHRHVRNCTLNPAASVHVKKEDWSRVVTGQRRLKLKTYWDSLGDSVRETLCSDDCVRQIFSDLGLRFPGMDDAAIALLCGMGFGAREAVAVLRESEGDILQATNALLGA